MNESLDEKEKRLPYKESQEYINSLIDRAVENAIMSSPEVRRRWRPGLMVSAAAVALLVIGIGLKAFHDERTATTTVMAIESPLDEFLNTLDDDEAAMLQCYDVEDIPEY